ncbi:MAG: D-alanyl-D-alanine carboxypeptidase family protein [Acidimicrobiales bacterium]
MSGSRNARIAGAVALGLMAAVVTPAASGAQEPDPAATERRRDDLRATAAEVDLEVDALQAASADVNAALVEIAANVRTQRAELDAAETAQVDAGRALAAAQETVAATERRVVDLNQKADELVVAAFVNPPADNALDAFRAESLSDAAIKQAVIEMEADTDAQVLELLDQAQRDLEADEQAKAAAADDAADKRAVAARELADVEAALAQQRTFAAEVEQRLDAKLAEVESLKALDKEFSDELAREQADVAARLAALRAADPPATDVPPPVIEPAPGGLVTVTCPTGGSITVAGSIAGDVQALLDAAAAAGVSLCGGGWRSPDQQIQLRREHCGSSNYAIYEMPASQCSPPTARPGSSLHEQGLAVDFTCDGGGAVDHGDACWNWLDANANSYGLYNLPSEPWHWSVDGA